MDPGKGQFYTRVPHDFPKPQISARCDKEEMNFLALNDIAMGKKTVHQARDYYVTAVKAFMKGEMDPYVKGLQFNVLKGNTGDRDMPADGMQ